MNFTTKTSNLVAALGAVSSAIAGNTTLRILECALFRQIGPNALTVTATDLEVQIEREASADFGKAGSAAAAVPAKRLLSLLKALPDVEVSVSVDEDFRVTLKAPQGDYEVFGYDPGDFPLMNEGKPSTVIDIGADVLKAIAEKTLFAAATDKLHPAMCGVLFDLRPSGSLFVSTNSKQLSRFALANHISAAKDVSVVVPKEALSIAASVAHGKGELLIADSYVGFDFGDVRILSRLIEELYPNHEAVTPKGGNRILTVDRDDLQAAVKRIAIFANGEARQMRMQIERGTLTLSAMDAYSGGSAEERVEATYDGEPFEIGFNCGYVADALSRLESDEAIFEMTTANRAALLRPSEQEDGEDFRVVVMPVMLNTFA